MIKARQPDFRGRTVAVLASGPSLRQEDIEAVRESGWVAIVTNATFLHAPWADVLFGFDARFWGVYGQRAKLEFKGRMVTHSQTLPNAHSVESTHGCEWFMPAGNSGACAANYALAGHPERVILLGCDAQLTGGRAHFFGNHEGGLTNCLSIGRWPSDFKQVAAKAAMMRIAVINASRETRLDCFPRAALEDLLPAKVNA